MEEIKIKGYCNLVVKKGDCNPDEKGIKIDLMGTMEKIVKWLNCVYYLQKAI